MTPAVLRDPARLDALRASGLLCAQPDPTLDRLTKLAARVLGARGAVLSLVLDDRVVVKSATGIAADGAREAPLSDSFCTHAVASGRPLVIGDAAAHELVRGSPALAGGGVRAYLGIPLTGRDGHSIGVLCAVEDRPRAWTDEDVDTLGDLAVAVVARIELRQASRRAERGLQLQAGGWRVLQMLAEGLPLELVLEQMAREVERVEPGWLVSVLLVPEGAELVRVGAAPSLPAGYAEAVDGRAPAAGKCPFGAAAACGERVLVADTETDARWDGARELARAFGLRSSWSTPLLSPAREVLGALEVHRLEPGLPCESDLELMELSANLAATALVRTRSEERLAASARRLGAAQAIARMGSWEWERARDRVLWSEHLFEILGFDGAEEPPGHAQFLAHVHPDDRERVARSIDGAFERRERGYEYECRFVRPDGRIRHIAVRADVDFDSTGKPVRSSGVAQDVSEQRRAERELGATARRLAEAQALAQIGSWEWDRQSDEIVWSQQALEIFGLDSDGGAPPYQEFLARVHPDDRDRVDRIAIEAHLGGGDGHYEYECRILRPDGELRTVRVRGDVTVDASGRPARSSGIAQDVTERRAALSRLAEAESLARIGSWEWDASRDEGTWSPQLYRLFGVDPESFEPSWAGALAFCHPDDRPIAEEQLRAAIAGPGSLDATARILAGDGELRWLRVRADVVRDERGKPVRMLGTVQDVTDWKRAEASLREAEERFGSAFDDAEIGMALADPRMRRLLRVNRALCETLGRSEEELLGLGPSDLVHPDEPPPDRRVLRELLDGRRRSASFERRYVRANGDVGIASIGVSLVKDEDGRPLYFVFRTRDMTEQRKAEEQLRYHALHSPLTGLPNRTLLLDRLRQALRLAERRSSTIALLAVDIDRFKSVNERFGLEAGDRVLASVGPRLAARVRPADTVAHLGGDQFLVLCEDLADEHEAPGLAARLGEALGEPIELPGVELRLTASIGIALVHDGGARAEDLIRDAESAMTRANERGGATWEIFDPSLRARLVERLRVEQELRGAIERGELRIEYQPLVAVDGHGLVGAEALVRWQHPERGLLLPAAFLPVAEETGLIVPLGRWVLAEAFRQATAWNGLVPRIWVNASARQIEHPGFVEDLAAALGESGIEPARVVIELTETGLMRSPGPEGTITALKGLGVGISLDDFGTGYSSLSHLRRFPVDSLKIDRSFVSDVAHDEQAQRIVEAIVGMGCALDLLVVAEGVETAEQRDVLVRLGCDAIQGFGIARPTPPERIPAKLAEIRSPPRQ